MFSQLFWQTGRAQRELTHRDIIKVDTSISCVCVCGVLFTSCCLSNLLLDFICDCFFQVTLRFKRKTARNLMFFCLLSPKCHLKEINSARWMCCFDSTHQDSKIRFYYVFLYYSTKKLRLCMERES